MMIKVWSQKCHEDYKRGQFLSPVVREPIDWLFQSTERLNLGEINKWLLEGTWTEIAVSISFPSYMKYALERDAEDLSNLL